MTNDALGSPRAITNAYGDLKARRDFYPFGEEINNGVGPRTTGQEYSSSSDDTRKKFATYQRDTETNLDFAQSRYFSPMHGRFTSPDEFKGGPDELFDFEKKASSNPTFYANLTYPQSLNKYHYTYNNPYKFNDLDGHNPQVRNTTRPRGGNASNRSRNRFYRGRGSTWAEGTGPARVRPNLGGRFEGSHLSSRWDAKTRLLSHSSFTSFKREYGPARPGYQWHHEGKNGGQACDPAIFFIFKILIAFTMQLNLLLQFRRERNIAGQTPFLFPKLLTLNLPAK